MADFACTLICGQTWCEPRRVGPLQVRACNTGSTALHLSDIHFRKSTLGSAYDLDADLRRELESDANRMHQNLGSPTAILISGDIAFSGTNEEYTDAESWLDDKLCKAVGGDPASVWCVPGNHDVDQSAIKPKPTYKDLRAKLRTCDPGDIESLLHKHLVEPHLFYDGITAYNEFAFHHGCDATRDKPVWDTGDWPSPVL